MYQGIFDMNIHNAGKSAWGNFNVTKFLVKFTFSVHLHYNTFYCNTVKYLASVSYTFLP